MCAGCVSCCFCCGVSSLAGCVLMRNYLGSDLFMLFALCCVDWLVGGLCCFGLGVV